MQEPRGIFLALGCGFIRFSSNEGGNFFDILARPAATTISHLPVFAANPPSYNSSNPNSSNFSGVGTPSSDHPR